MLQYVWNEDLADDESMMFVAENQCWDKTTLKQLKEEYNIIFMTSGDAVKPIMIIDRNYSEPLIVIGSEDDGTIYFHRKYGQFENCFSSYWIKSLIADLEETLKICNSRKDN